MVTPVQDLIRIQLKRNLNRRVQILLLPEDQTR